MPRSVVRSIRQWCSLTSCTPNHSAAMFTMMVAIVFSRQSTSPSAVPSRMQSTSSSNCCHSALLVDLGPRSAGSCCYWLWALCGLQRHGSCAMENTTQARSQNQNQFYYQVGLHIRGISFGFCGAYRDTERRTRSKTNTNRTVITNEPFMKTR